MTERGWSSAGLALVEKDERLWTVEEAARLLGAPCSAARLRFLIDWYAIEPVGTRRPDRIDARGRRPRVYRAIDIIKAYDERPRAA